ncbi:MAG TPA: hypothetical protein VE866_06760 [Candidatus Binatia bacterium]|jgi:hypothetical protein|nr:hypothetical protein [Candidatus Binatia bacterium]
MNHRVFLGVFGGCLLANALFAQPNSPNQASGTQGADLIAKVQSTPASKLDKDLPAIPLQEWLYAQAGKAGKLNWVFKPRPASGKVPEPDCVEVDGIANNGRPFVVLIDVGTDVDRPRVFRTAVIMADKGYAAGVRKLSDLPGALRKAYSGYQ